MAVEEYNIDDAWKHESTSSPAFSDDLDEAVDAIEDCPLDTLGLPMKRDEQVDFELYDEDCTATIQYLNGICTKHNVKLNVPDQSDEGPTIVFLLPD
jgi:hypothetical protein